MKKKIAFLIGILFLLLFSINTIKTLGGCWKIEHPFSGHCFGDLELACLETLNETPDCNTIQEVE